MPRISIKQYQSVVEFLKRKNTGTELQRTEANEQKKSMRKFNLLCQDRRIVFFSVPLCFLCVHGGWNNEKLSLAKTFYITFRMLNVNCI